VAALPEPTERCCKHRRSARPRKPPPDRHAACGRRPDPTTACGDGRWRTALDCTGRAAPSKGPPRPAACCRRTTRVMVPLLWRAPQSTPGCHRFFARWAGCSRRAHEPTKAPVPASPREGQRIPESRDAFRHQESR